MRGIVFDENLEGHAEYLLHLLTALDLRDFWDDLGLRMETVRTLGYQPGVKDRILWKRCQDERFVLLTDNRNDDAVDSLGRTICDSLLDISLPVITIANKERFERDRRYALIVAEKFLDVISDVVIGKFLGIGRLYIPPRPIV